MPCAPKPRIATRLPCNGASERSASRQICAIGRYRWRAVRERPSEGIDSNACRPLRCRKVELLLPLGHRYRESFGTSRHIENDFEFQSKRQGCASLAENKICIEPATRPNLK